MIIKYGKGKIDKVHKEGEWKDIEEERKKEEKQKKKDKGN